MARKLEAAHTRLYFCVPICPKRLVLRRKHQRRPSGKYVLTAWASAGVQPGQGVASDRLTGSKRLQRAAKQGNARAAALLQLLRVANDGAFAALVSGRAAGQGGPGNGSSARKDAHDGDDSDQVEVRSDPEAPWAGPLATSREATRLVGGVLRWQRWLDAVMSQAAQRPADSLDTPIRLVLRLAIYELFCNQLPEHVVGEFVSLARSALPERRAAGGVVNGVLRGALRARSAGTLEVPKVPQPACRIESRQELRQRARAIGVALSHPTPLIVRWLRQYGERATVRLCEINNAAPEYCIRVAASEKRPAVEAALAELGVRWRPGLLLPEDYIRVRTGLQSILHSSLLRSGLVAVQDEAAGMAVRLLQPQHGDLILDACAAPGGKAAYMLLRAAAAGGAKVAQEPCRVVALDVSLARIGLLERAASAADLESQLAVGAADLLALVGSRGVHLEKLPDVALSWLQARPDLHVPSALCGGAATEGHFDKVLLDAPCSGSGVLAKRADLRWRPQVTDPTALVQLQAQLLQAAARAVRPGGRLLYSTCSLEAAENEVQVSRFLSSPAGAEFEVEPPPLGCEIPGRIVTEGGAVACLPHRDGTDGSFAVRLRRQG